MWIGNGAGPVKMAAGSVGAQGGNFFMRTLTTPIIEIAGDGKTAKGLWYSIGQSVRGSIDESGKISVGTGWMWEKYGVDFVKENGKWKIWHLINLMDQGPVDSSQASGQGGPGGQGAPGGQQESKFKKAPESFHWSPTAVLKIDPKFPDPYYTFSETFAY